MTPFAVKSRYFNLYEAFKKQAESIGYIYNERFTAFEESKMKDYECLWFDKGWYELDAKQKAFALSNCDASSKHFDLETEWEEAVEFAKDQMLGENKSTTSQTIVVSINEIAEWKGVEIHQIRITA